MKEINFIIMQKLGVEMMIQQYNLKSFHRDLQTFNLFSIYQFHYFHYFHYFGYFHLNLNFN